MTINIRSNVFETNSSSSHSFSLTFPCAGDKILETIKPDGNGQIILTGGNYTSSEFEIRTALA